MGYQFAAVLAFAAVAVLLPFGLLFGFKFIRPSFPSDDKSLIYECGEKPIGRAWFNFNPRFYLVALVFEIFEVDLALTFPVAVVYKDWVAAGPAFAWVAFAAGLSSLPSQGIEKLSIVAAFFQASSSSVPSITTGSSVNRQAYDETDGFGELAEAAGR